MAFYPCGTSVFAPLAFVFVSPSSFLRPRVSILGLSPASIVFYILCLVLRLRSISFITRQIVLWILSWLLCLYWEGVESTTAGHHEFTILIFDFTLPSSAEFAIGVGGNMVMSRNSPTVAGPWPTPVYNWGAALSLFFSHQLRSSPCKAWPLMGCV